MHFSFDSGTTRPNRLTSKKNEDYHRQYSRYCLGTMSNSTYRRYIDKCIINWSFFKGDQWIFDEDLEAFFMDESGDYRNRIKWKKNLIKPMVQQYVGNAIRLSYNARAECISDFVINKREKDLQELKAFQRITELFPFFKDIITDRIPIGETEIETEEIFMNTFVDEYEGDINNLIDFISKEVNMNELKVQISRNIALCGLGIYKGYETGDVYRADAVNPLNFFWDMSATKPDLSDSSYMGEWMFMDAATIFERYPKLSSDERKAIESYGASKSSSFQQMVNRVFVESGDKIPVYEVYWKDIEECEYGWVEDSAGYPYYTRINHGSSDYTDKDLITAPTEKHREEMGESKKHKIVLDVLRYAIVISSEDIGNSDGDILLEYGEAPYQDKNLYDPGNVKFPYKCYTWVYDRGEILTPLDDAIDPQRFLNRTLSVVESHLSNMRGSGTAIAKEAVDDSEAETVRNINASKPVFVDTSRTGSVQNSIGQYGTNIGGDTYQMFQAVREIEQGMQDVTGVNEAMTGTQGGGSDVLVGVIEAQIQRGSLVQEPFYYALTRILHQGYEHQATVGKAIYCDNPRRLASMVGDKGFQNIIITKEHLLQDYRIFVDRSETKEQGVQAGNQLLFTLIQAGLIDDKIFSNLFDRADSRMIARALREYAKAKQQAQNMQDKQQAGQASQQQIQEEELMNQMQQAQQAQGETEQINNDLAHQRELEKIDRKQQAGVR